jgi:hypothetical protein
MPFRRSLVAGVVVCALVASVPARGAALTVSKCQAGKHRCVARLVAGLLGCQATADAKGAADAACTQKQQARFAGGSRPAKGCFAKLEAKGGCKTTGDAAALGSAAGTFADAVGAALDPSRTASACAAGKARCVRKKTAGLLACHAKAELKGTLDPACVAKQKKRFDGGPKPAKACFAKLEKKGACLTTGDAVAEETQVDTFVDAVVCALDPSAGTCPGQCPSAPGYGGGETALAVTSVSATIRDLGSAPVASLPVAIVGLELAFTGVTQSDGSVTVSAGHTLHRAVFRFGDALTYPMLDVPLTMATSTFPALVTGAFPVTGVALQPGTTATSNGVSVAVAAGADVAIDTLTYDTPDKQQFRAVVLPVAQESAVVGPSGLGLGLLVGVAPAGTFICPSATVTVPNAAGWSAGAAVEFYLLGNDVGQGWAPFGGWAKLSDGHVSGDGTSVSTDPGAGFPVLDVFGVRLAP